MMNGYHHSSAVRRAIGNADSMPQADHGVWYIIECADDDGVNRVCALLNEQFDFATIADILDWDVDDVKFVAGAFLSSEGLDALAVI